MQATNERESTTKVVSHEAPESRKTLGMASTKEIRAFLSDLSLRPLSQREFLCRLLKRAAAVHAAMKDSAVIPDDTHHTSTS